MFEPTAMFACGTEVQHMMKACVHMLVDLMRPTTIFLQAPRKCLLPSLLGLSSHLKNDALRRSASPVIMSIPLLPLYSQAYFISYKAELILKKDVYSCPRGRHKVGCHQGRAP